MLQLLKPAQGTGSTAGGPAPSGTGATTDGADPRSSPAAPTPASAPATCSTTTTSTSSSSSSNQRRGDVSYSQSDYLSQTSVMSNLNPVAGQDHHSAPPSGVGEFHTNGDSSSGRMGHHPAYSQHHTAPQSEPTAHYYGQYTQHDAALQQKHQDQVGDGGINNTGTSANNGMPQSQAPVPIRIEPLPQDDTTQGTRGANDVYVTENLQHTGYGGLGMGLGKLEGTQRVSSNNIIPPQGYGRYPDEGNNTHQTAHTQRHEFEYNNGSEKAGADPMSTPLKIPRYHTSNSAMFGDTKNYNLPPTSMSEMVGLPRKSDGNHNNSGEVLNSSGSYRAAIRASMYSPGSIAEHSDLYGKPPQHQQDVADARLPRPMERPSDAAPLIAKTEDGVDNIPTTTPTSQQEERHVVAGEKQGVTAVDSSPLRSGDDQTAVHSDSGIVHDGGSNTSSNSGTSAEPGDDSALKNSHSSPPPTSRGVSTPVGPVNGSFRYDGPPMMPSSTSTPADRAERNEEGLNMQRRASSAESNNPLSSPFMTASSSGPASIASSGSDMRRSPPPSYLQGMPGMPHFPSPQYHGGSTSGDESGSERRHSLSIPNPRTPSVGPSGFLSPSGGVLTPSPRHPMSSPMTPGSGSNHSLSPEPPHLPPPIFDGKKDVYFCHLCSYVGQSQFHFKQHMDTHFEHRCPHCDYTSRTEGRLKRHIKDFHSDIPPENYSGNRTPRQAAPKPKVFKCKQCDYQSMIKVDFWEHSRVHIKEDKVLQCPKCPFVTEYKHHLEYHLRNHFGSKPFKCLKCNYACVNKSMLNSHMKSHTNVYQYRCADCTYATKYCHSLKLHLKKYNHKPATVLNADGSLPVDGSGDFELVSKRGPPRGPRGPRKGERAEGPVMSPMMMPQMGMNGLPPPGLMPGYWPMMPPLPNGGLHPPPPLIPVSGSSFMPNMPMPGHPHLEHVAMMQRHREMAEHAAEKEMADRSANGTPPFSRVKCVICDFTTDSRPSLNDHMLKVHAKENQDLLNMFGVQPDMLDEHSMAAAAAAAAAAAVASSGQHMSSDPNKNEVSETAATPIKQEHGTDSRQSSPPPANQAWIMNTSQPSAQRSTPGSEMFPSPMFRSTPQSCGRDRPQPPAMDSMQQQMMKERYNVAIAAEIATSIEAEAKQSGECPLDLTKARKEQMQQMAAGSMFFNPSFMISQMQKRKFDEVSMVAMAAASAAQGSYPPQDSPQSFSNDNNGTPRKRSRKGKAYKLDTICQKLQERYGDGESPPPPQDAGSNDEDDEESDSINSGTNGEGQSRRQSGTGDNDNEKIDYNAIHSSLSELNREMSMDSYRGESNGKGPAGEADDEATGNGHEHGSSAAGYAFSGSMNRRKMYVVRHNEEQARDGEGSDMNGQGAYRKDSRANNEDDEEAIADRRPSTDSPSESRPSTPPYECNHCGMAFRDCVMYTVHMGYHGYQDPFKCNMCGHLAGNRVEFFLHIARAAHE